VRGGLLGDTVRNKTLLFLPPAALTLARHGSQDLCSAFVAAVVHVNELAARKSIASEALPVATWLYLGLLPSAFLGPRGCSRSVASASFVHVWAIETHRVRTSSSVAISATTRQYRACTRHSLGAERRSIK
jgi:hypothetical protein